MCRITTQHEQDKTSCSRQQNNMKKTIKQHFKDNNTTCRGQQHNTQRTAYINNSNHINNNNHQQCTTIFIHVHADQKNTAIIDLNCISFYKAPRRHSSSNQFSLHFKNVHVYQTAIYYYIFSKIDQSLNPLSSCRPQGIVDSTLVPNMFTSDTQSFVNIPLFMHNTLQNVAEIHFL